MIDFQIWPLWGPSFGEGSFDHRPWLGACVPCRMDRSSCPPCLLVYMGRCCSSDRMEGHRSRVGNRKNPKQERSVGREYDEVVAWRR